MAQAAFGTLVAMDGSAPLDRAEVLLFLAVRARHVRFAS
jgi:hypothetical protein